MTVPRRPVATTQPSDAPRLGVVLAVLAVGLLVVAAPRPTVDIDSVGWTVVAAALHDIAVVALVLWGSLATGWLVLRSLRLPSLDPILDLAGCMLVGAGVWAGVLMAQGLAGAFDSVAVVLTSCAVFAVAVPGAHLWGLGARSKDGWVRLAHIARLGSIGKIALGLTAIGSVMLVLLALTPSLHWDAAMYHLDLPAEWLERGRVFVPVDNLHAAYTGIPHMAYSFLLSLGAIHAPALLQASFGLATVLAAGALAAACISSEAAPWAMILMWCSTAFVLVVSTALIDGLVVLLVALGLAYLVAFFEGEPRAAGGVVLLAAAAIAFKYQAVPYVVGMLVVLGAGALVRRYRMDLRSTAMATLVGIGLAAPFVAKNVLLFGDPVYPFIGGTLLPPWLVELSGETGRVYAAPVAGILGAAREPFNLSDWAFRPEMLSAERLGYLQGIPLVYLLGLAAPFTARGRRALLTVGGPVVIGMALVLLVSPRTNLRYLLPYVVAFSVVGAAGAVNISGRLGSRSVWVLLLVAALGLIPTARYAIDSLGSAGGLAAAVGAESEAEWLERPEHQEERRVRLAGPELAARYPGETILLFEGRGWFFPGTALQDNVMTNQPYLLRVLDGECRRPTGPTHVLVNERARDLLYARGGAPDWADEWPAFVDRCLEIVAVEDGYTLYAFAR